MYGEDASGRKVSLLNDSNDTSTSISTTKYQNALFVRPTLPHRSRDTYSVSSSSQQSREGSNKSSRSSISCSPRHSPPTPPLVRLDSRSSIQTLKTPSPMTPHYNFDPLDHHDFNKNQQGGLPYYTNGYQQHNGGDDGNPYPPMQNPNAHSYYPGMNTQQALPPMFSNMGHAYSQQANLQLQAPSLSQYPTTHHINPLVPPNQNQSLQSLPPLQSNQPQIPIAKAKNEPNSAPPVTSSTVAPIKTDRATPITSSAISTSTSTSTTTTTTTTAPTKKSTTASSGGPSSGTPTSSLPKKKYPCPHAKEYKCTDTFTTSGHAARHGKKHTGEKNVNCPTCGKAFTRKDNMKQHERTHKPGHSGRGGSGTVDSPTGVAVGTKARKRTLSGSTLASLASSSSVAAGANAGIEEEEEEDDDEDADGDVDMDVALTQNPSQTSSAKKERPPMGKSKLSEILEQVATGRGDADMDADGEADGEGESPGLDALATVAAGEMGRHNR